MRRGDAFQKKKGLCSPLAGIVKVGKFFDTAWKKIKKDAIVCPGGMLKGHLKKLQDSIYKECNDEKVCVQCVQLCL